MKTPQLSAIVLLGVLASMPGHAQSSDKKLIAYNGMTALKPSYVASHVRAMERLPFDGVIMRLPKVALVFTKKAWTEKDYGDELAALPQIKWGSFTDNFMLLLSAANMDWFDDGDWAAVTTNVTLLTKAAKAGHCKGLAFDPEPYKSQGTSPWAYSAQGRKGEKSFAEYQAIVRKRGGQFMDAIQGQMPQVTILSFFLLSQLDAGKPFEQQKYGLLPAFLTGMLDRAGKGVVIVDGNERSYYYMSANQFANARDRIKGGLLEHISTADWGRYRTQVQDGAALYVDYVFGQLPPPASPGNYMSSMDQARWFEHNAYWALRTTDRYVWCYSEKANWFTGQGVPPGAVDALASAKSKAASGLPLGFDISTFYPTARRQQKQAGGQ